MNDLYLIINTCKPYFSNIFNIIEQINKSKFVKTNVLIISGQEESDSITYINGIKIIKVKYTGIHLTSAIYINENNNLYKNVKYWILLPDTVKFGVLFFNRINYIYNNFLNKNNNIIHSLPFIDPKIRPTMDMGILHTKQILNMTDYLKKIKTFDITTNNLKKLKRQLIYDENIILGIDPVSKNNSTKHNSIILKKQNIKYVIGKKKI